MNKVLMVNEMSGLSSGYGFYGRELMKRLVSEGFEVAELAAFANPEEHGGYATQVPWKVYFNEDNAQTKNSPEFQGNPYNIFGRYSFDKVCIDFKPEYVLDVRDRWMASYMFSSPLRRHYNAIYMPPVDGYPQKEDWLDELSDADAVLTYQDWSGDVLKYQGGNKIKYFGSAPMAASPHFFPCQADEIQKIRQLIGIQPNDIIIGMVARNQRRKLFPELFQMFRKFLDKTKKDNVYLYCHTSYPDNMGWDIPVYLKEYGLASKVYFTYICYDGRCRYAHTTKFNGTTCCCPKCGQPSSRMSNVNNSVSEEGFRYVYNVFDLYIQYCTKEGFGSPVVEAAACGVPVAGTDYSACTDTLAKLNGYKIKPCILWSEIETGVNSAYPDPDHSISILEEFCGLTPKQRFMKKLEARQLFEKHYNNWNKSTDRWIEAILSTPPRNTWDSRPDIKYPAQMLDDKTIQSVSHSDYAAWLITQVLREPKLHTYFHSKLIKDLTTGQTFNAPPGAYANDDSFYFQRNNFQPFDRKSAYRYVASIRNNINHWEQVRYDHR